MLMNERSHCEDWRSHKDSFSLFPGFRFVAENQPHMKVFEGRKSAAEKACQRVHKTLVLIFDHAEMFPIRTTCEELQIEALCGSCGNHHLMSSPRKHRQEEVRFRVLRLL